MNNQPTDETTGDIEFVFDTNAFGETVRESKFVKRITTPIHLVKGDTLTFIYTQESGEMNVCAVELVFILKNDD